MKNFNNFMDFISFFNTEEKCHKFLKSILWKEEKVCPFCGSHKVIEYKSNFKKIRCSCCKKDFSIRKGTIFDDSRISLQKWFACIYLINSNKKGISSIQLGKQVGITQKSAWFVLQRIRKATESDLFKQPLKNIVEIDETYIGGKAGNKHMKDRIKAKGVYDKSIIMGMVERNGTVKTQQIEDTTAKTLLKHIYNSVEENSLLITDELQSYKSIGHSYIHRQVNHSQDEYVRKLNGLKLHTNTIEGFWSLVKRGLYGIHHWASKKHIQKYLSLYSFAYNTRNLEDNQKFNLFLKNLQNTKITYKNLINN